ncbi:MAG: precorrin-2 dehydrogenase/sirohydrochlorin ferrochelatase family protein [Armatimonadota bacterium]
MPYYPVNLDLKGRRCIVIGGGPVAERKVLMLLDFGATVTVISPEVEPGLSDLASSGIIEHRKGVFEPGLLDGAFLAIAAANDREINKAVCTEAGKRAILVNVVDDPELCTFFVPAVVRRGDLTISISTSGKSPSLARRIRKELESEYGPEYAELTEILHEVRDAVKARYSEMDERRAAFQRILDSDVMDLLKQGRSEEARQRAVDCI